MSSLATFVMGIMSKLGGIFFKETDWAKAEYKDWAWLKPIVKVIDGAFWPFMIVVASAGAIFIVILAINLARAETADKATEAKKRLINVAIALGSIIILVVLLSLFVSYLPQIFTNIGTVAGTSII